MRTYAVFFFLIEALQVGHASAAGDPPSSSEVIASIWWVPLVSAFIGAVSALVVPFIKDMYVQRRNDALSRKIQQQEIFRNYAAPLATACERLLWRFGEIFIENRHGFLKRATLPLVFNEYKRTSTLYRIASLMGWIRAINLELSALPRGSSGLLTPMAASISSFQRALADGPHVEIHRLEQMCKNWDIDISNIDEKTKRKIAHHLEMRLYKEAGDKLKYDSQSLLNLSDQEKLDLCHHLADFLCEQLHRSAIPPQVIADFKNTAINRISYREALIYRDWQDAIGDNMISSDPDSIRRYKVKGYEEFESVIGQQSLWMEVFRESIADIDFEKRDTGDFRGKQLRELAIHVSGILIALQKTPDGDLVSADARQLADKISHLVTS